MSSQSQEVLGENVVKALGDKTNDKRKQAALVVEEKVKEAVRSGGNSQVQRILDCLRSDFIESQQANSRKGGLIGLASMAIGLDSKVTQFLPQLMKPVLELFKDEDARVRYYACEALYNVSQISGDAVLDYFNEIFDGICRLYADLDTEVKSGVQVLDRSMKDIVMRGTEKFRVGDFIIILSQKMQAQSHTSVKQLGLAWITLLLKMPDVDLISYLPHYLEGLFDMLGDLTKDTRHNADFCLNELLLKRVIHSPRPKALQVIADTLGSVTKGCKATDNCCRLSALCWLSEYVNLQMDAIRQDGKGLGQSWRDHLPNLVGATLHCIKDNEEEIVQLAVQSNNELLEMVQSSSNEVPVEIIVEQLLSSLQAQDQIKEVCTACLQWICMLLSQSPDKMRQSRTLPRLFTPIFETLLHRDEEVVLAALRVLALIMEGSSNLDDCEQLDGTDGGSLFIEVTHRLLDLFKRDRNMLEERGRLMIRQLCGHLDPRRLYITVARNLRKMGDAGDTDLELAQQLVQTFSWVLLTSKETEIIREELLQSGPHIDIDMPQQGGSRKSVASSTSDVAAEGSYLTFFLELLTAWFHNPVSALALCLWAQEYELASELTARLAVFEPSIDLVRQLDQLVHLLESPIFARLRLRLLEPHRHPALLKCVLSLAMLLPQAGAFDSLLNRIEVVQSGLLLEAQREAGSRDPKPIRKGSWFSKGTAPATQGHATNLASLLEQFEKVTQVRQH